MLCSLALAAAVIALRSSGANRMGTILPLASPLGSFGLPTFFGLVGAGMFSELPHNGCFDCGSWENYWRYVKHGHVPLRFFWVASIVHPSINHGLPENIGGYRCYRNRYGRSATQS
jgi:hypothetical protein